MSTPNPTPGPMPPDARRVLSLLSAEEFEHVASTVIDNNPGMVRELGHRITGEALAYVATCAQFREAHIAPSPVVDEGWHALILHTALYARVCAALGGFVHHNPERTEETRYDGGVIQRTIVAMAEAGYAADLALWAGPEEGGVEVQANVWHSPGPNCVPITPNPPGVPKPKGVPLPT